MTQIRLSRLDTFSTSTRLASLALCLLSSGCSSDSGEEGASAADCGSCSADAGSGNGSESGNGSGDGSGEATNPIDDLYAAGCDYDEGLIDLELEDTGLAVEPGKELVICGAMDPAASAGEGVSDRDMFVVHTAAELEIRIDSVPHPTAQSNNGQPIQWTLSVGPEDWITGFQGREDHYGTDYGTVAGPVRPQQHYLIDVRALADPPLSGATPYRIRIKESGCEPSADGSYLEQYDGLDHTGNDMVKNGYVGSSWGLVMTDDDPFDAPEPTAITVGKTTNHTLFGNSSASPRVSYYFDDGDAYEIGVGVSTDEVTVSLVPLDNDALLHLAVVDPYSFAITQEGIGHGVQLMAGEVQAHRVIKDAPNKIWLWVGRWEDYGYPGVDYAVQVCGTSL